jgi:hypothetical protein
MTWVAMRTAVRTLSPKTRNPEDLNPNGPCRKVQRVRGVYLRKGRQSVHESNRASLGPKDIVVRIEGLGFRAQGSGLRARDQGYLRLGKKTREQRALRLHDIAVGEFEARAAHLALQHIFGVVGARQRKLTFSTLRS